MPHAEPSPKSGAPRRRPRGSFISESIGRAVKDEALDGLLDQLTAYVGDYGYAMRRRTVVPHIGHLSMPELVRLCPADDGRATVAALASGLVTAMETEPTPAEVANGVHAAILKDMDITGGLVLGSVRKTSGRAIGSATFRRLYLGLADEAEAAALHQEAVAVRERALGRPLDEADAAAVLPGIIPLGNLKWAGDDIADVGSLGRLLAAGWDIPSQITLGPLEVVLTETTATG